MSDAWDPAQVGTARAWPCFVGLGAGFGAVAFSYMIRGLTRVFSGHTDYSSAGHAANPLVPWLGPWFVVLAPVVAGLIYGPLVYRFAPEARGHGVPEVMLAVARKGGRIRPQVALVKSLASALCIGGGGSVGREGPIVQIGSALGSSLAQLVRLDERRIRLLVACGAAGGIAATFNAPLAGVFFAMELILGQWAAESFGMVVLSSVTASVVGRAMLGNEPFLQAARLPRRPPRAVPAVRAARVVAGLFGVGLLPRPLRDRGRLRLGLAGTRVAAPAVGGLLLGGVLLVLPQMYGVGYPVLGDAVSGRYTIAVPVRAAGRQGGRLQPDDRDRRLGRRLRAEPVLRRDAGRRVRRGGARAWRPMAGSPGAYALVGMGALFAGAARAPITAVVILFELTGEYTIILPLMLAIVLATGISHLVSHDTVYTRKLLRRGIDLDEPATRACGT